MRVGEDDFLVGADVVPSKVEKGLQLLAVMANGYGKRTDLKEYKVQKRGGRGILTANITTKTGPLVSAHVVSEENSEIIAISRKGQVIRTGIDGISVLKRATQGVRIMRLDGSDRLALVDLV
jgi:DNA gyrase subunit A